MVMKHTAYALALCAVGSLGVMAPKAAFPQAGRDQVCVYEHANYGGWERCFSIGDDIRDLGNLRNSISSLRIRGRAEITLYEHPNFQGAEVTVDRDVPDIRQWRRTWNDEVDSLRVSKAGFRRQPVRGQQRRDSVCVYKHVNFQGDSQCWDAGEEVPDLRALGWNDTISSIRTFGNVRVAVYEDHYFEGRRLIVEGDLADLTHQSAGGANWNDRISSLRVSGAGHGGRGGRH